MNFLKVVLLIVGSSTFVGAQPFNSCVVFFIGKLHFFSCQNTEINYYAQQYRQQSPPRRTILCVALDNPREQHLLAEQSKWFIVDTIIGDFHRSISRSYNVKTYPSMIEFDETGKELRRAIGLHFFRKVETRAVCDSIRTANSAQILELPFLVGHIADATLDAGSRLWLLDTWLSSVLCISPDHGTIINRYPIDADDSYRFVGNDTSLPVRASRANRLYPLYLYGLLLDSTRSVHLWLSALDGFTDQIPHYAYYLVPLRHNHIEWNSAAKIVKDESAPIVYDKLLQCTSRLAAVGKLYSSTSDEPTHIVAVWDNFSGTLPTTAAVSGQTTNEQLTPIGCTDGSLIFYSQASASLIRYSLPIDTTPSFYQIGKPYADSPEEQWHCVGGMLAGDSCILIHVRTKESLDTPPAQAHVAVVLQGYNFKTKTRWYATVTPCLVDDELQKVVFCGIADNNLALLYQWKRKSAQLWKLPLEHIAGHATPYK